MSDPDDDDLQTIQLVDGEAWAYDADYLDPDCEEAPDGVLAVLNREGELFVLVKRGATRSWINVERKGEAPKPNIRRVQ